MQNPNRRQFLAKTALATGSLPILSQAADFGDRFKLALSLYSLRAMIKDGSLNALDFPAFTVDTFGIHAIDTWEGGMDRAKLDDPAYLAELKSRAEKANSHLFLHMAGAYDCSEAKREASLQGILKSLGRGEQLGVDLLRVFLKAPGEDEAAGVEACVESLKPLADAAAGKDIVVAIEPGASKLSQYGAFLVKVVTQLNHPACKLMPDFGKQKENIYDGTEVMLPHSISVSCKMHSFDENGNQPDFDYPRLMKMIAASDYRGYLAIEWEGKALEPVPGVKASKKLIETSLAAI